jgi:hypothetical protein
MRNEVNFPGAALTSGLVAFLIALFWAIIEVGGNH